jgi:RNA polymerase-binding transcription factor DksA
MMSTEEKMHSVRMQRRAKAPARNGTQYAGLRRELEIELEELAPPEGGVGEETLRGLAPSARRRAQQILDVLRRMDSEAFGVCVGCRSPIAYERLSVIPETTLCAQCSWRREL